MQNELHAVLKRTNAEEVFRDQRPPTREKRSASASSKALSHLARRHHREDPQRLVTEISVEKMSPASFMTQVGEHGYRNVFGLLLVGLRDLKGQKPLPDSIGNAFDDVAGCEPDNTTYIQMKLGQSQIKEPGSAMALQQSVKGAQGRRSVARTRLMIDLVNLFEDHNRISDLATDQVPEELAGT